MPNPPQTYEDDHGRRLTIQFDSDPTAEDIHEVFQRQLGPYKRNRGDSAEPQAKAKAAPPFPPQRMIDPRPQARLAPAIPDKDYQPPYGYGGNAWYRDPGFIAREAKDTTGMEGRVTQIGKGPLASYRYDEPTQIMSPSMPTYKDVRGGLGTALIAAPVVAVGAAIPPLLPSLAGMGLFGTVGAGLLGGTAAFEAQYGFDQLLKAADKPLAKTGDMNYESLQKDMASFRKRNPYAAELAANAVQIPFSNPFSPSLTERFAGAGFGSVLSAGGGYLNRNAAGEEQTLEAFGKDALAGGAIGLAFPSAGADGESSRAKGRAHEIEGNVSTRADAKLRAAEIKNLQGLHGDLSIGETIPLPNGPRLIGKYSDGREVFIIGTNAKTGEEVMQFGRDGEGATIETFKTVPTEKVPDEFSVFGIKDANGLYQAIKKVNPNISDQQAQDSALLVESLARGMSKELGTDPDLWYQQNLAGLTREGEAIARKFADNWNADAVANGAKPVARPKDFMGYTRQAKDYTDNINDGRQIVGLLATADVSTLPHETLGHVFLNGLEKAALENNAVAKNDLEAVLRWTGKETVADAQEPLARGMEKYLKDGKAPNESLQPTFDRFKGWLDKVYNTVKKTFFGSKTVDELTKAGARPLSPDMVSMLQRYFGDVEGVTFDTGRTTKEVGGSGRENPSVNVNHGAGTDSGATGGTRILRPGTGAIGGRSTTTGEGGTDRGRERAPTDTTNGGQRTGFEIEDESNTLFQWYRGLGSNWKSDKDNGGRARTYLDSAFEVVRAAMFDEDPDVVNWRRLYKEDSIEYVDPTDGKTRRYYPDFLVEQADGKFRVEEIKPESFVSDLVVQAKAEAARKHYGEQGIEYRFVSEDTLTNKRIAKARTALKNRAVQDEKGKPLFQRLHPSIPSAPDTPLAQAARKAGVSLEAALRIPVPSPITNPDAYRIAVLKRVAAGRPPSGTLPMPFPVRLLLPRPTDRKDEDRKRQQQNQQSLPLTPRETLLTRAAAVGRQKRIEAARNAQKYNRSSPRSRP